MASSVLTVEEREAVDAIVGYEWPWSEIRPIIDRLVSRLETIETRNPATDSSDDAADMAETDAYVANAKREAAEARPVEWRCSVCGSDLPAGLVELDGGHVRSEDGVDIPCGPCYRVETARPNATTVEAMAELDEATRERDGARLASKSLMQTAAWLWDQLRKLEAERDRYADEMLKWSQSCATATWERDRYARALRRQARVALHAKGWYVSERLFAKTSVHEAKLMMREKKGPWRETWGGKT